MDVHHDITSRRMRVTFDGPGGHPWADRQVPNAADALGRAAAALAQLADAERAKGAGASVTVTRVHGGESLTSIPARAWFELDVRTLNATRLPALLDEQLQVFNRARIDSSRGDPLRGGRSLAHTIDIIGDRPGEALDARHPLVQLANDATRWHDIEPQFASASTDANVPLSRGIPAITIGAGGVGGGAHTLDEWYTEHCRRPDRERAASIRSF